MFNAAIEEIREAIPKIPRKQQKVGDYFYRHPETLGVLSLTDFAARIGTSEPTVNRFCKTLGYNGFLDFSRTMHDLRNNKISHATYFHIARFCNDNNNEVGSLGRKIIEKDAANLGKLLENYPEEKISQCVSLMNESSSICVLGSMSAYPATIYLEQLLAKITPKLLPMQTADILKAAVISRLDKNSLVFCLAFPRYPKAVIELSKEAAQKKATIIAITKDDSSPLAEISNILFTLDVGIFSYIDILGPVFALINAICMEFSLRQGDASKKNLVQFDKTVEDAFFMTGRKAVTKNYDDPFVDTPGMNRATDE